MSQAQGTLFACGSDPMLVASKHIQLHPSAAENFLGNVEERMKSKQKPGQALGTYWTSNSRNQLILTLLILMFITKRGETALNYFYVFSLFNYCQYY